MYTVITTNFMGSNITLGITGLPVTISGEVVDGNSAANIIGIRQAGGNRIYIDATKIAFFY